jgi:molybdate transport system substrate-binding protein
VGEGGEGHRPAGELTGMSEFRVMTSGAFTAAHLALMPQLERVTKAKVVTASTSIGTGESSIPNRLKRGEVVDIVIVSDAVLDQFVRDGYVLADGVRILARSIIAMAVRAGAPKPDIGTPGALRKRCSTQARSAIPRASAAPT